MVCGYLYGATRSFGEPAEFVGLLLGAGPERDGGGDVLAQGVVRDAQYGRLQHVGVFVEDFLDLAGGRRCRRPG